MKRIIKTPIKWVVNVGIRICIGLTRLLPARIWLQIRNGAQIVRQVDYAGAPIRITVDSRIKNDVRARESNKEPGTVEVTPSVFTGL